MFLSLNNFLIWFNSSGWLTNDKAQIPWGRDSLGDGWGVHSRIEKPWHGSTVALPPYPVLAFDSYISYQGWHWRSYFSSALSISNPQRGVHLCRTQGEQELTVPRVCSVWSSAERGTRDITYGLISQFGFSRIDRERHPQRSTGSLSQPGSWAHGCSPAGLYRGTLRCDHLVWLPSRSSALQLRHHAGWRVSDYMPSCWHSHAPLSEQIICSLWSICLLNSRGV